MAWRGSTTVQDRIFACLPYLLPLVQGLVFGQFLFSNFPALLIVFIPLQPLLWLNSGFVGLAVFFALYLLVVRNESISHFIRFNTMQAILINVILALCGIVIGILRFPGAAFAIETLSSTIFLGVVVAVIYAVVQSVRGKYAEIPALSDAVYMQVR